MTELPPLAFYTVMTPSLTPAEATVEARAIGYRGIEWRVTDVPPEVRDEAPSFFRNNRCTLAPHEADAELGRGLCLEAGVQVVNLGTYIDVGDTSAVERHMAFAQRIGAPSIRVGTAPTGPDYLDRRGRSERFLADVEALARAHGVRALVEMHHGTVCASASQALRLVERRDPDHVGVLYDVGNLVLEGFEDYASGIAMLGPYLALVHVKNASLERSAGGPWRRPWAPLPSGVADIPAFLAALLASGYRGWLVVEDFGGDGDDRTRLRDDHEYLGTLLQGLGMGGTK